MQSNNIYLLTNDLKLTKHQVKRMVTILLDTWPGFEDYSKWINTAADVVHKLFTGEMQHLIGCPQNNRGLVHPKVIAALIQVKAEGSLTFAEINERQDVKVWTHTFVKDDVDVLEGEHYYFMQGKPRNLIHGHLLKKSKVLHVGNWALVKRTPAKKTAHSVVFPVKAKKAAPPKAKR